MQHTGLVLSLEKQALQAIRAELMLRHQFESADMRPDAEELTHVHFDDFAVVLLQHMYQLPLETKLDQPFYTNTNAFHLQMASIISVFDAVDVDCRGVIDFNDFTNFCLRLGRLLFKPSIKRSISSFLQFQPQSNTNLSSIKLRYLPEFRLLFVSDSDAPRVRLYNKEGKFISKALPVYEARKLHRAKFHKTLTYYEKATHEKDLYQYRLTDKELDPNKGNILDVIYVESEKQLVFSCSNSYLIYSDAKKNIFDVNGNLKVENYMRTKHPLYGLHYCKPLEMIIGYPGEGSSHVFEVIDPSTRSLKFEIDKHNTKILAICEVVLDKVRPLKNHYFVSSSIDKKLLMWPSAPLSTLLNKNPIKRMLRVADTIDFELRGHEHAIQSIAFAPIQELIVGCGFDFEIFAWDPFTRDLIMRFVGHFKSILGIQIVNAPNEKLISMDDSGVLKMWSINKDLGVYGEQESSLGLNIPQPANIKDFAKIDEDGRVLGVLTDQLNLVRIEGETLDDLKPITSGLGICPVSGRMFALYRSAIQVIDILSASHVKRVAFLDPDRVSSTDLLINKGEEMRMSTVVMSAEERQQQQRHLKQVGYIDMRDTVSAVAFDERGKKVFIGTADGRILLFDSFTFGLLKQLTSEEEDSAFKQQGSVLQLIYVDRDELLIALHINGALKIFGGCHRGGYQSSDHHHQPVHSNADGAGANMPSPATFKRNKSPKRRRSSATTNGVPNNNHAFQFDENMDFNFPRANGGKPPAIPSLLRECDLGVVMDQSFVGMDLSLAQNLISVLTKSGMVYNFDYTNLDFVNCIQIEDQPVHSANINNNKDAQASSPAPGSPVVPQGRSRGSFFVTEAKEELEASGKPTIKKNEGGITIAEAVETAAKYFMTGDEANAAATQVEKDANIAATNARAHASSTTNQSVNDHATQYVAIQYVPMVPIMLIFSNTNTITAWCVKSMDYKFLYAWNLFDVTYNIFGAQFYEKFLWPGVSHEETHSRFKPHTAASITNVKMYIIHGDAMLTGVTPESLKEADVASQHKEAVSKSHHNTTKAKQNGARLSFSSSVTSTTKSVQLPPSINIGNNSSTSNATSSSNKFEWILVVGNEDGQLITQDITMMVTKAGAIDHMKKHEHALSVYQKFKPKRYRVNDASEYNSTFYRAMMPDTWMEKLQNPLKRDTVLKQLLSKKLQTQKEKEALQEATEAFLHTTPHILTPGHLLQRQQQHNNANEDDQSTSGTPHHHSPMRNGPLRISALGRKTLRLAQRHNKIKSVHLQLEGHVEEFVTGLYAWNAYQMGNVRAITFYHPYLNYQSDHNHTNYEAFEIQPHKHKLPLLVTLSDLGVIRMWTFCGTCIGEHIDEKTGKQDDVNVVAEALRAADGGADIQHEEEEEEEDDETRRRKEAEEARKKRLHLEPPSTTFVTTVLSDEQHDGLDLVTSTNAKRRTPMDAMATLSSKIFVMDRRKALTVKRFQVTMKPSAASTTQTSSPAPSTGGSIPHSRNVSILKHVTAGALPTDTSSIIARAASAAAALVNDLSATTGGVGSDPNQPVTNMSFTTMIQSMNQNLAAQHSHVRHILSVARTDSSIDNQHLVRRPLGSKGWYLPSVAIYLPSMLNSCNDGIVEIQVGTNGSGDILPMDSPMHFTLVQHYYFKSILQWVLPLIGAEVNQMFSRRIREALGMSAAEPPLTQPNLTLPSMVDSPAAANVTRYALNSNQTATAVVATTSTVVNAHNKSNITNTTMSDNNIKASKRRPQSASAALNGSRKRSMSASKSSHSLRRRPSLTEEEMHQKEVKERSAQALGSTDGDKSGNLAQILDTMTEKELEVASYLQQQHERKFAKESMSNLIDYIQDSQYFENNPLKNASSKCFFFENFESEKIRRIRTPSRTSADYDKMEAEIRAMIAEEDALKAAKRTKKRPSSAPATRRPPLPNKNNTLENSINIAKDNNTVNNGEIVTIDNNIPMIYLQLPSVDMNVTAPGSVVVAASALNMTPCSPGIRGVGGVAAGGALSPPIISLPSYIGIMPENDTASNRITNLIVTNDSNPDCVSNTDSDNALLASQSKARPRSAPATSAGRAPSVLPPPSLLKLPANSPLSRSPSSPNTNTKKQALLSLSPSSAMFESTRAQNLQGITAASSSASPTKEMKQIDLLIHQLEDVSINIYDEEGIRHREKASTISVDSSAEGRGTNLASPLPQEGLSLSETGFTPIASVQDLLLHRAHSSLSATSTKNGDHNDSANRLHGKRLCRKIKPVLGQATLANTFSNLPRLQEISQHYNDVVLAAKLASQGFEYYDPARKRKQEERIRQKNRLQRKLVAAKDRDAYVEEEKFEDYHDIDREARKLQARRILQQAQAMGDKSSFGYYKSEDLLGFLHFLDLLTPVAMEDIHLEKQLLLFYYDDQGNDYSKFVKDQYFYEIDEILAYVTVFLDKDHMLAHQLVFFRDEAPNIPYIPLFHLIGFVFSLSKSKPLQLKIFMFVTAAQAIYDLLRSAQMPRDLQAVTSARRSAVAAEREVRDKGLLGASLSTASLTHKPSHQKLLSTVSSMTSLNTTNNSALNNTNSEMNHDTGRTQDSQDTTETPTNHHNSNSQNNGTAKANNGYNKSNNSLLSRKASFAPNTLRKTVSLQQQHNNNNTNVSNNNPPNENDNTLGKSASKVRFDEGTAAAVSDIADTNNNTHNNTNNNSELNSVLDDIATFIPIDDDENDDDDYDEIYLSLNNSAKSNFNRSISKSNLHKNNNNSTNNGSNTSNKEVAKQRASRLHLQLIDMIRSDRVVNKVLGEENVLSLLQSVEKNETNTVNNTDISNNNNNNGGTISVSLSAPVTPYDNITEAFATTNNTITNINNYNISSNVKRPSTAPSRRAVASSIFSSSRRKPTPALDQYEDEEDALENETQRQEKLQYKQDIVLLKRVFVVTNPTRYVVTPNATRGFRQWIIRKRSFQKVTKMLNLWCDDNFECLNVQDFVDIFHGLVPKQEKDSYRIMRSLTMSLSRMGLRLINELSGEVLQKIFEGILEVKIVAG